MILRTDTLPIPIEYHALYIVSQIYTEIELIGAYSGIIFRDVFSQKPQCFRLKAAMFLV